MGDWLQRSYLWMLPSHIYLGHHALIDSSWLHNHFTAKSAATAYERACGRFYSGKMAMFGEAVMGFLRANQKGLPRWTRGVWLSNTISNDSHIIGAPNRIFLTRSIRRMPTSFDLEWLGEITVLFWKYGCASLGHRLIHAKRVVPPPAVAYDSSLHLPDKDAKDVRDYAKACTRCRLTATLARTQFAWWYKDLEHTLCAHVGKKKDKQGNAIWLRRSRLVAREYTWLQPDREALFSPVTSNIASRILRICFFALREHQDTMMLAIDVKDAFFDSQGGTANACTLHRMPLGCGIEIWWNLLVKAWQSLRPTRRFCVQNLVIFCWWFMWTTFWWLGHARQWWKSWSHTCNQGMMFQTEIMSNVGDELTFLKRTHQLLESGRMVVKIHGKHLDQLCKLLQLSKRLQNKKSPGHSEIEIPDKTDELSAHDGSVYRSCVGILLYLLPNLPQCQYVIRYLPLYVLLAATENDDCAEAPCGIPGWSCRPTCFPQMEGTSLTLDCWKLMRMMSRCWNCSVMQVGHQTVTLDVQCQGLPFSLEVAWFTPPVELTRFLSLPSAESETYAAASAVMDAILITAIISLSWLLQLTILMCLHVDSSAARGILSRRGVGRLRHLSCRVLWFQNLVGEKLLMVKPFLGAINPADTATKRLSVNRLESLLYLFGIWIVQTTLLRDNMTQVESSGMFLNLSRTALPETGSTCCLVGRANRSHGQKFSRIDYAGNCRHLLDYSADFVRGLPVDAQWSADLQWSFGQQWWWHEFRGDVMQWDRDKAQGWRPTVPDFPAFSPEGMISWMFERCYRRRCSISNGNSSRALAYTERMMLLVDLYDHVMASGDATRKEATDMFNTLPELPSDEGNLTHRTNEPRESQKIRLTTAHAAMISMQRAWLTWMWTITATMGPSHSHVWFWFCGRYYLQDTHGGCCAAHFPVRYQHKFPHRLRLQLDQWLHMTPPQWKGCGHGHMPVCWADSHEQSDITTLGESENILNRDTGFREDLQIFEMEIWLPESACMTRSRETAGWGGA